MPTPPIPQPLRAAAGLAAVAIDSARRLPEQLVGFPVLAVSAALQASLKAQQRYAELVVRGDQLLGQLRGQADGTPSWARFDEDVDEHGAGFADDRVGIADDQVGFADDQVGFAGGGGRVQSAFDLAEDDPEVADLLGGGEEEVAAFADAADLDEADGDVDLAGAGPLGADVAAAEVADLAEDLAAAADLADTTTAAGAAELAADVAEADPGAGDADLLAAAEELVEVDPPADDGADAEAVADALAADGYLASDPPIPGYDGLTLPQLRGRLRSLSVAQVEALLAYERQAQARAPFQSMLENRLATLRSR